MINKIIDKLLIVNVGILIFSFLFIWESPKPHIYQEEEIDIPWDELEFSQEPEPLFVTMTVYNPVSSQTDSDPLVTADNSTISEKKLKNGELKWVAISRDLLGTFSFGDKIVVPPGRHGLGGIYEVHDLMAPRFTKCIDILVHQDIRTTGKYKKVEITKWEPSLEF